MGKIFVQIASYRDPELRPTLKDLFEKADKPDNLKVCVAWQHSSDDKWDTLDEYINDERVIILDIPHSESEGACWARNLIQKKYRGEKYTLQLDSHHRFIEGWDTELITMLKSLQEKGFKKPLLTSYACSYDPENEPNGRVTVPWRMDFDRFSPEGIIHTMPSSIDEWKELQYPIPARFYSAHFTFTLGRFCREVPHDPELYFHGEEPSIAVRAFTHGYDLFHPHKCIVWHEYTRIGKKKNWDDYKEWGERDKRSHKRFRELLGSGCERIPDYGKYGLGTERPLDMWERYAGIRFRDRSAQQQTYDKLNPPNPVYEDEIEYDLSFKVKFKHYLDIHKSAFPEDDYEFWVIAFEDKDGNPLYRADANRAEVQRLLRKPGEFVNILREYAGDPPYQWVVWPYSTSKEWCERIVNVIDYEA